MMDGTAIPAAEVCRNRRRDGRIGTLADMMVFLSKDTALGARGASISQWDGLPVRPVGWPSRPTFPFIGS